MAGHFESKVVLITGGIQALGRLPPWRLLIKEPKL